ncbi:MAG: EAL domain-containing protein [Gammaproteobacteria bacterium]|nr:EAL domain-containing protein [Gammaproteobacteria bacterium]
MDTDSDCQLYFNQYLSLIQGFYPQVLGLVVYDQVLNCIWNSDSDISKQGLLREHIEEHHSKSCSTAQCDLLKPLDVDLFYEFIELKSPSDELLLTLVPYFKDLDSSLPVSLEGQQNIDLLNQFLLTEYQQGIELASREQELNSMADELSRRYEELNLIYKAEDQALNIFHGRELLRQLVINTSRFLSVDVIYLFLPPKNINFYEFQNDQPLPEFELLFTFLRDQVYPQLQLENTPIVLNHEGDMKQLGVNGKLNYKVVVSVIVNAENEVIGSLAIANRDFTKDFTNSDRNLVDVMAKKASKISQANFDPLTGLENSNSFELIVKDLLKQSWTSGVQHAIANVDIDRMAVINDISGRDAGDLLIKKVGKKLASLVRSRDVVARLGSDKFGVLLENCDLAKSQIVMRKIADEVSKIEMQWEGETHEVSISIGIAPITHSSRSVTGLLNAAETARNVSKEYGRNNIHVLDSNDSNLLYRKDQIQWVGRIQSALKHDRFVLYAQRIQPIDPAANPAHYEILIRMQEEDGSVTPPGKFLPAAENFFLMASIDRWVIDRAFCQLSEYSGGMAIPECQISVNLSGQSLNDPLNLVAYVIEKLEKYKIPGNAICFEITESAAIANLDDARLFIERARELGCKFSLDDFGTGLSSFAYLKNLQVSYLKIDGSFVRDVMTDPVCESIVSAINQVGHAMNLQTIAEFVETEEIHNKLAGLGVDYSQGYGIAKPEVFTAQLYNQLKSTNQG